MKFLPLALAALLFAGQATASTYSMTPPNHHFSGIGLLTAEIPGQQKIDCVITMKGYTNDNGPATVTSTSVAAVLDPTCENALIGPGAILMRPQTQQGGYVTHFKLFMPSGVDCGMAAQLPFTLNDAGAFVINATAPSKAGPCVLFILIPFGALSISPSR
jgi:hypothetical protein